MDDAGFVGCAQYHRSGAVAEQHAGRPVAPVKNAAERFCADNQNFFCHAAFDIGVGSVEGVHKSCAYGLYVERGTAVGHAEFVLHDGGGGGELHIGCGGGDDNQVDFVCRDACGGQCAAGGFCGQITGFFVFVCNMAELDTGACGYPFVGCVHFLRQVVVADAVGGEVAACSKNFGILHV